MDEGTTNRTVAATNMNATSSRAHTIVGIHFVQKAKNKAGQEMAKTSIVNLVDLAGRYILYPIIFWPKFLNGAPDMFNVYCILLLSCIPLFVYAELACNEMQF